MFRNNAKQIVVACSVSVLTMVVLSLAAILVFSIFIFNEYLPAEYTRVFVIISMCILGFGGTLVAGGVLGSNAEYVTFLSLCIYDLLLIFIAVFFFEGISVKLFYVIIASWAGSAVSWILLKRKKRTHIKRGKRNGRC